MFITLKMFVCSLIRIYLYHDPLSHLFLFFNFLFMPFSTNLMPFLSDFIWSYLILPYIILFHPIQSYLILSYSTLPYSILFCPNLSNTTLSYRHISYLTYLICLLYSGGSDGPPAVILGDPTRAVTAMSLSNDRNILYAGKHPHSCIISTIFSIISTVSPFTVHFLFFWMINLGFFPSSKIRFLFCSA